MATRKAELCTTSHCWLPFYYGRTTRRRAHENVAHIASLWCAAKHQINSPHIVQGDRCATKYFPTFSMSSSSAPAVCKLGIRRRSQKDSCKVSPLVLRFSLAHPPIPTSKHSKRKGERRPALLGLGVSCAGRKGRLESKSTHNDHHSVSFSSFSLCSRGR